MNHRFSWLPTLIVFGVALASLSFVAQKREIWRNDELRYAAVASEMDAPSGHLLVPTLHGERYTDKPPVFFWAEQIAAHVFGIPYHHAVLVPSVVGAAFTLALVYLLASNAAGSAVGFTAATILLASEMFASLSIRGNLDALLTATTTTVMATYWLAETAGAGRRRTLLLFTGAIAWSAGTLIKGPVALVLPASAILAYRFGRPATERIPSRQLWMMWSLGLLPLGLWAWGAWRVAGPDYLTDLVWGHGIGHPIGKVDKLKPFYAYLKSFPGDFSPWSALLPALVAWSFLRYKERWPRFLIAWVFAPLVLLSLFPAKRHLYALPILPGAALTTAMMLSDPALGRMGTMLRRWGLRLIGLLLATVAFAIGIVQGIIALKWPLPHAAWVSIVSSFTQDHFLALALLVVLLVVGSGLLLFSDSPRSRLIASCTASISVACFLLGVAYPIQDQGNSSMAFYQRVQDQIGNDPLYTYGFPPIGDRDLATHVWTESTIQNLPDAESTLHSHELPDCFWIVTDERRIERQGWPPHAQEIDREVLAFAPDRLLLRRERTQPPLPEERPDSTTPHESDEVVAAL